MAVRAFDQVWKSVTGINAADMIGKRFHFVTYDATSKAAIPAVGAKVVGVAYEGNKAGQEEMVVAQGYAFIILGAAVAAGAEVMSDANGAAIAWDGATTPAHRSAGILAVGGNAGDIGTVFLN